MSDKEVGELWRYGDPRSHETIKALILKLVKERAAQYWYAGRTCAEDESLHVRQALRDFGIEPEDWK